MLYSLKDLIFGDTSLSFILQAFIGTVFIPTYISCSYTEHLYTSEGGFFSIDIRNYIKQVTN